jgi:hypothetical protein
MVSGPSRVSGEVAERWILNREKLWPFAAASKPGLFTMRGRRRGESLFHWAIAPIFGFDRSPAT